MRILFIVKSDNYKYRPLGFIWMLLKEYTWLLKEIMWPQTNLYLLFGYITNLICLFILFNLVICLVKV